MQSLILSPLGRFDDTVEVVERKGIGHPDTICDALAETLSRNLCREYRQRFGRILHHNVDKALLSGGRSSPAFGGGSVLAPINVYLAGRATTGVGREVLDIEDIAASGSRDWLKANLHALDAERDVRIHTLIQPGSSELQDLFSRREQAPLANDTSFGVGHAPLSDLERLVIAIEQRLNSRDRAHEHPEWGEDVKLMGVRRGGVLHLTVACAMIGRHLAHMDDYLAAKGALAQLAMEVAQAHGFKNCEIGVNAADNPASSHVYLTVTGTSAEAGDDGQVGRGNRVNGVISPCRPMSLEAAAGKNPVSHVGKIYNVVAPKIAQAIVSAIPEIVAAECLMVSCIGQPVASPAIVAIKVATQDAAPIDRFRRDIEETVQDRLSGIGNLMDGFVAGAIELY